MLHAVAVVDVIVAVVDVAVVVGAATPSAGLENGRINLVVANGVSGDAILGTERVDSALYGIQGVRLIHELQQRRIGRHINGVHHIDARLERARQTHIAARPGEHLLGSIIPGIHTSYILPELTCLHCRIVEYARLFGAQCGTSLAGMLHQQQMPHWYGHIFAHCCHR